MRIAAVGNGPIDPRYASVIDAHDMVVRFNTAHHFGTTGRRIDVLVLVNTGGSGQRMHEIDGYINPAALAGAREVWIARHPEVIAAQRANPINDPLSWVDHSDAIVAKLLKGKRWRFIDAEDYLEAHSTLKTFGALDTHEPSTGMVTLFHLRRTIKRPRVTLFGFTHEGWHGHPWEAERAYVAANRSWIRTAPTTPTAWFRMASMAMAMLFAVFDLATLTLSRR